MFGQHVFSEFTTDTGNFSTIGAAVELELGCAELSNKTPRLDKVFFVLV